MTPPPPLNWRVLAEQTLHRLHRRQHLIVLTNESVRRDDLLFAVAFAPAGVWKRAMATRSCMPTSVSRAHGAGNPAPGLEASLKTQ